MVAELDAKDEQVGALDKRIVRDQKLLRDSAVKRDIRDALVGAGVPPKMLSACAAVIISALQVEVVEVDDGSFRADLDREGAIHAWLLTDEASLTHLR